MKRHLAIIVLVLAGLAIYTELLSIKAYGLFFRWIYSVPFIMVCISAPIVLVLNITHYIARKTIASFLPILFCIAAIIIVVWHSNYRASLDNSQSAFRATTFEIGNDGGLVFDFKKNGHLKAERYDHWLYTYYWGKYYKQGDTIKLDIPLDFNLGKQATLSDTSFSIIGDTIKFNLIRQTIQ